MSTNSTIDTKGSDLLATGCYEYISAVSLRTPEIFRRLREVTAKHPRAMMIGDEQETQFFNLFFKVLKPKKAIELGVYTGYTTMMIAYNLPEDGKVYALDITDEYTQIGMPFWKELGVDHKIDFRVAPALETLDALISDPSQLETFDFAFIDADKENYVQYYERLLKLMRKGGVIAVDNVLWSGSVYNKEHRSYNGPIAEGFRQFNEMVHKDDRVEISMLALGDGVTLVLKK